MDEGLLRRKVGEIRRPANKLLAFLESMKHCLPVFRFLRGFLVQTADMWYRVWTANSLMI